MPVTTFTKWVWVTSLSIGSARGYIADPAVYRAYMTRLIARRDIEGVRVLLDEYAAAHRRDGLWEWGQMNWLRLTGDHQGIVDLAGASNMSELP